MTEIKFHTHQENNETMAILPGEWVSFYALDLPDFSEGKLLKILPGLMADMVAGPLNENHISVISNDKGHKSIIAVCNKNYLNQVRTEAGQKGLVVKSIWPEYALIKPPAEHVHILKSVNGEKASVRRSDGTGFTVPAQMLEHVVNNQQKIEVTEDYYPDGAGLATGEYSPNPPINDFLKYGARLIGLVASLFAIWFIQTWMDISALEEERLNYADASMEIFKSTYPNVTRIVNIETQMRNLSQGDAAGKKVGFLSTSNAVFDAISNSPGTKLENMTYDQNNGMEQTDITISSMNFSEAGLLENKLQENGFNVEQGGSSQDGEKIFSNYRLVRNTQ